MKKIYILKVDEAHWDYDCYDGKVIVADSEQRAREIANADTGDEGEIWNNAALVSCQVVNAEIESVILSSYNAS